MEAICPVSTLVPGLSVAHSGLPAERASELRLVTGHAGRLELESPAPLLTNPAGNAEAGFVTSTAEANRVQTEDAPRLVSSVNTSDTSSPNTDSDSPLISTPSRPVSNLTGGGTVRTNVPQGAPPTQTTPKSSTPTNAPSPDDDIRPMTLAASTPSSMILPADESGGGSGGGGSGGGESGGGDDDPEPPLITCSGGWSAAELIDPNVPGAYEMGPVPVGSIIIAIISSPFGEGEIDPDTIEWSGGTDYQNYFASDADEPGPSSVELIKDVAKNFDQYVFIVGAEVKTYALEVSCKYKINENTDTATVKSTLTFTSARPSVPRYGAIFHTPNQFKAGLASRGMGIYADTSINHDYLAGNFMDLQLVSFTDTWLDKQNVTTTISSAGDKDLDTGIREKPGEVVDPPPIGMPLSGDEGHHFYNYWVLPDDFQWPDGKPDNNPDSEQVTVGDSPTISTDNPATAQIDSQNTKQISISSDISTYLMYRPGGGVWIALARLDWTVNVAVNAPWVDRTFDDPDPNPSVILSGDDAFPTWSRRSTDEDYQVNPPQ